MSKYLKKQQMLIDAATEANTVILSAPAASPALPHDSGANKPGNRRRIGKTRHLGTANAS